VVCLAPRALREIVRPRRLSGVVVRPLNFTVRRRHEAAIPCSFGCLFHAGLRSTMQGGFF